MVIIIVFFSPVFKPFFLKQKNCKSASCFFAHAPRAKWSHRKSLKIKRISTWGFYTSGGKAASKGMSREKGAYRKKTLYSPADPFTIKVAEVMARKQITKSDRNFKPNHHQRITFRNAIVQAISDCIVHHCFHPARCILASSSNHFTSDFTPSTLQPSSASLHCQWVY